MRSRARLLLFAGMIAVAGLSPVADRLGHDGADASTTINWPSGVFAGSTINTAAVQAFASYRGRAVDVAMAFPRRDTWLNFATDTWTVKQYAGFAGRLSLGVPLTIGSTTLKQVAAGSQDAYFLAFANNLRSLGRGASDLRLAWEFNGNWQPWSAYSATDFVAAFRHVAKLLKTALPSATIDWNGNWGTSQCGHNPFTELYPGDDVVDVIGVDTYDGGWVPATTSTQFDTWRTSKYGLQAWLDFAKAHGKKFAVPEWGLVSGQEGDNVAFVDGMHAFFVTNAASLAFESYCNHGARALYDPVAMPKSSAEYRSLW